MSSIPTYRSRATPRNYTTRAWMVFMMLVLAMALASMAVVATEAQARSSFYGFPKQVLMKGKTVAWDVFFWVNRPDRHYYLETHGRWERVPGTHISYGNESWHFHVKTADFGEFSF
jgi:hypothetical protein